MVDICLRPSVAVLPKPSFIAPCAVSSLHRFVFFRIFSCGLFVHAQLIDHCWGPNCPEAVKKKLKEVQESNLNVIINYIYALSWTNFFLVSWANLIILCWYLGAKGTNSWEWEKLYDQFMACEGDWLKSDLVMESKDSKETTKFGRWKTMSRLVTHLKLLVWIFNDQHNYLYIYIVIHLSLDQAKIARTLWIATRRKIWSMISSNARRSRRCTKRMKIFQPMRWILHALFIYHEIISPKNMEQQIHPCPTVLPGSACLLGLGHLPRRGCQTPYRVRWRYLEGCWSWQDRWELGVGTPEPLIWSHPCLNWWSFLFTLKHMLLRGAIPMCHDGSSSSAAMPAAKPKSRPKVKPVPKAKTAQQEATKADVLLSIPQPCSAKHKSLIANQTCQVMKDASTAILECKSWKSKLEAANTQGPQHIILLFMFFFCWLLLAVVIPNLLSTFILRPTNMLQALVADCNAYLGDLETNRVSLEADVAAGKSEEEIRLKTQELSKNLLDYRAAARHCKKHCQKPSVPKAKAAAEKST